jgi:hypothetical protein
MNDKTSNFVGYSQTVGISSGDTTVTTNCSGKITTYDPNSGKITTYDPNSNWATPLSGGNAITYIDGSEYNSISTLITNPNTMKTKQVKVAVFTVTRNEKSEVTSAKLVKELWVEVKNGTSLDLAVAKQLDKDFDPSTTVVREIYSVTF